MPDKVEIFKDMVDNGKMAKRNADFNITVNANHLRAIISKHLEPINEYLTRAEDVEDIIDIDLIIRDLL